MLRRQLSSLLLAPGFLRGRGLHLLFNLRHPNTVSCHHAVGLLEVRRRVAPPFLNPRQRARSLRRSLLQRLALCPQSVHLLLQLHQLRVQSLALRLERRRRLLSLRNQFLLLRSRLAIALAGQRPHLQSPLDPRRLLFHLAQRRTRVRRLQLRVSAFVGLGLQRRGQPLHLALQPRRRRLRLRQRGLGRIQLFANVAQLALQRQRPLRPHTSAGHRRIMERLAVRTQEEALRILARQPPRRVRILRDEAVSQLRQYPLQRTAKAVQHAHAVLQRNHAVGRVHPVPCSLFPSV